MDSARGVAAIVVCCHNSLCSSSCDALARNGQRTIALFLLFRVQSFVCNSSCEGMFQTCFECGRRGLPISPLLQTPDNYFEVSGPLARPQFHNFASKKTFSQKNPRVRKIRVRNSGAGKGSPNFMDTWKNAFFLQENLCP